MNNVYLLPLNRRARTVTRTTGPLFNPGTLQWITAQAMHYATVEGQEAMRFAISLAGLECSRHASEEAWV